MSIHCTCNLMLRRPMYFNHQCRSMKTVEEVIYSLTGNIIVQMPKLTSCFLSTLPRVILTKYAFIPALWLPKVTTAASSKDLTQCMYIQSHTSQYCELQPVAKAHVHVCIHGRKSAGQVYYAVNLMNPF